MSRASNRFDGLVRAAAAQRYTLFLENLRRALIQIGMGVAAAAFGCAWGAEWVLRRMARGAGVSLVAFTIPEAFLALVQLSLTMGILASIPFILCRVLLLAPILSHGMTRKRLVAFWGVATVLFYGGVFFCLRITLPYGVRFLLSFETDYLNPMISARKFVSFCSIFVFGFGLIFQVPVIMVLSGQLFTIDVKTVARHRRYAIVLIAIFSAVLTPTPDIVNQMLMGLPLYLLFELGLLGMRFFG